MLMMKELVPAVAPAAAPSTAEERGKRAAGLTPLLVTVVEAKNLPLKDVSSKTDPFVTVEAAGIKSQTDVQRGTCNPVWEQVLTLRCVFVPGTREELVISCWHEDVFEDELIGRETLDISAVLHDREVADEWIDLIDERGRRAIGASVRIVVQNGKAPPLMQLCAAEDVTLDQLEKSITQEPSQCDEREVEEATGRTCLHLLLANDLMDDAMLSLLLKCNHKQSRVADRHGTLPLSMLCKKYGATEAQLTLMVKCHPAAARTANRFGKLALHFLCRNPSLTRPMLGIVLGAFPGAAEAKDVSGNLPLHYLAKNKSLSKDLLQAFFDSVGLERARAYADTPNKLGRVPLSELVTSEAFTDQHLRVMLRVSEEATVKKDRYGNPPLHYLGWSNEITPFQELVAEEAVAAIDERAARAAGIGPLGRFVDDNLALKLLINVQKYSLWFHDFSHADMRRMQHGDDLGENRLLVTRFQKGDFIMRKGEAATFLAILLQGELGVRIGKGGGFPRRLHKGALFGERGMFNAGNLRAADVIALTDGYIGTMLYSELELLGESYPDLMRTFNLQMAKGALEEKLADTGMSVDDLEQVSKQQRIDSNGSTHHSLTNHLPSPSYRTRWNATSTSCSCCRRAHDGSRGTRSWSISERVCTRTLRQRGTRIRRSRRRRRSSKEARRSAKRSRAR